MLVALVLCTAGFLAYCYFVPVPHRQFDSAWYHTRRDVTEAAGRHVPEAPQMGRAPRSGRSLRASDRSWSRHRAPRRILPRPVGRGFALLRIAVCIVLFCLPSAAGLRLVSARGAIALEGATRQLPVITQPSNQAMQLTASKPDVHAWSDCRRERILRGMHRGLAAADLVTR